MFILPAVLVLVMVAGNVGQGVVPGDGHAAQLPHAAMADTQSTAQSLAETYGGTNPIETCVTCQIWGTTDTGTSTPPATTADALVNKATGDVNQSYTLFSAPSLGNGFKWRLNYDSQYAINYATYDAIGGYPGPLGWGWTSNSNTDVINVGTAPNPLQYEAQVTEPSGAQVDFTQPTNGVCPTNPDQQLATAPNSAQQYCAFGRVDAQFGTSASYGSYLLNQHGGKQNSTYNFYGELVNEGIPGSTSNSQILTSHYGVAVTGSTGVCPAYNNGQVTYCDTVVDTTGRAISTGFSPFGQAVYTQDPASHLWLYHYGSTNDLTSISDPNNNVWSFNYDSTAAWPYSYGLTGVRDPDGHQTTIAYDHSTTDGNQGLVSTVTDAMSPGASTTHFTFGTPGTPNCGTCMGPGQAQSTLTVDPSGNRSIDTYGLGVQLSDRQCLTVNCSITDPAQSNATIYQNNYYPIGQIPTSVVQVTTKPNGNVITDTTDPPGNVLIHEVETSASASHASVTDAAYNSYDEKCWQAPTATITPPPSLPPTLPGACGSPPSHSTVNGYDTSGDLTSSTDPNGNTTNYGYNASLQMCWKTLPDQSPGSGPTCSAPPLGASTYAYNTSNELTSSSAIDGNASPYTHDITTNTSFNGYGEVVTSVSPNGNVSGGNAAANTTTNYYDTAGRLFEVQSPYLSSTSFKYIGIILDAVGNVLSVYDPYAGVATTAAYDADNRACWKYLAYSTSTSCSAPPSGSTLTSYRADTKDVVTVTDPNGNLTTTAYGNSLFPDSPTTVTTPASQTGAPPDITSNVYDRVGNLCVTGSFGTSLYGGSAPACVVTANYTYKTYDEFGNATSTTDPSGHLTQYAYGDGRFPTLATTVTPPSPQGAISNTYDFDGQLTNQVNGAGMPVSVAYTPAGKVCWRDPVAVSNPSCSSPPSGLGGTVGASEYAYSAAEREYLRVDVGAGGAFLFSGSTFDSQGQVLTAVNDNAQTVTYAYDFASDNTCVSYPIPGGTPSCAPPTGTVVTYAYDSSGRMTTETPWAGSALSFTYDLRSNVNTIVGYPSGTGPQLGTSASQTMNYDPANRLLNQTVTGLPLVGAGFSDTFTSNPNELYNTENSSAGTTSIYNHSYTYNNKKQVQVGGADTYVTSPTGQIQTDTPVGGTNNIANTYNGASELTKVTNNITSTTASYGYDSAGNRCTAIGGATAAGCGSPSGATTAGWSNYGQLCWSGSGGTTSGSGSCSTPPTSTILNPTTTYTYDGNGLRVSDQVGAAAVQNFTYDTVTRPGQPLVMIDGTNAYVYGPANFGAGTAPLEQIPLLTSLLPSYLFSDPNGVRSLMTTVANLLGLATQTWTYGTYGARTATLLGGLGSTPFGFQGGYTDPSGLVYFINRYYDPSTAQWLSVDPAVTTTGQPYVITGADPINLTDPMGLVCDFCGQGNSRDETAGGAQRKPAANTGDQFFAIAGQDVSSAYTATINAVNRAGNAVNSAARTGFNAVNNQVNRLPGANWINSHISGSCLLQGAGFAAAVVASGGGAAVYTFVYRLGLGFLSEGESAAGAAVAGGFIGCVTPPTPP
jgi:RHS repeat-associated protein